MSRIELTATVAYLVVTGIALVGCGDIPPAQSAKESSGNQLPKTEVNDDEAERSQTYVTCRATLTAFEKDYRWFVDSSFGHDDGVAPLASLVLVEPSMYADRSIGILFIYSADAAETSPPDEADIGRQFSVQIPDHFLMGKPVTIDNLSVRHFRKIEP